MQEVFIPSSSSRITSDGTPRIVDVMGATVTVDRYGTALLRVSIDHRPLLVRWRKLVKPYVPSGYSSGHTAFASQSRASSGTCGFLE